MLKLPDTVKVLLFEQLTSDFFSIFIDDDYLKIDAVIPQDEDYLDLKDSYKKIRFIANLVYTLLISKKFEKAKSILHNALQVIQMILFYCFFTRMLISV